MARYLPTLKRAKLDKAQLPPGAPFERRPLAALIVAVRALVREDRGERVRKMYEIYVPSELGNMPALFSFEATLEKLLPKRPPDLLRCTDLQPRQVGGGYRAARGKKKQPTFHGYRFGDTIKTASKRIDQFLPDAFLVAQETRVWAWPLLWLRYDSQQAPQEIVMLVGPRGGLRYFVGQPPAD